MIRLDLRSWGASVTSFPRFRLELGPALIPPIWLRTGKLLSIPPPHLSYGTAVLEHHLEASTSMTHARLYPYFVSWPISDSQAWAYHSYPLPRKSYSPPPTVSLSSGNQSSSLLIAEPSFASPMARSVLLCTVKNKGLLLQDISSWLFRWASWILHMRH